MLGYHAKLFDNPRRIGRDVNAQSKGNTHARQYTHCLVNTSHTGNIGSVARAMKTMGLSDLALVDPVQEPDSHASALAAGATDILANATIVDNLHDAISDCGLVVATSARNRTLDWPLLGPRESAAKVLQESHSA